MAESKTPVSICPQGHLSPALAQTARPGDPPARCPECGAPVVRYMISDPFATVGPGRSQLAPAAPESTQFDPDLAGADDGAPSYGPATIAGPPSTPAASPSQIPPQTFPPPLSRSQAASPGLTPTPRSIRPPIPGAPTFDGYTILSEIGRGAMGVVYKARHDRLKRAVALKVIRFDPGADSDSLEWFQAEAEAIARLHHPNIVQIFEVGEQNGRPFLALEFVPGGTLKKRLGGKSQPIQASAHFVEQVARAIHAAHLRGIVHRDLKPANILLEPSRADADQEQGGERLTEAEHVFGIPKVSDFGLSKRIDDDFDPVRYGDVVGTPLYMAPEQARGDTEDVGPTADVFALGAILYEMITGRPPFLADSADAVLAKLSKEAAVPPRKLRSQIPRDLELIVMRCLEKDPRDRYRTAVALAEDLHRFLDHQPIRARSTGPVFRAWSWCLHNRVPASILVAVTLVLVVGQMRLRQLSASIVAKSAQASAAQQTATIGEVWSLYAAITQEVRNAKEDASKIELTHKYPSESEGAHAIPIPARFTIYLGEKMEELIEDSPDGRKGNMFSKLHVHSNYPFRDRPGNPPKPNSFASQALAYYAAHPDKKSQPFELIDTDVEDRTVLRYATAVPMKASCLGCHNKPENYEKKYRPNARTDWKEGDVRGVLVLEIPLTREFKNTNEAVFGTYLLLAGIGTAAFAASWLTLTIARR